MKEGLLIDEINERIQFNFRTSDFFLTKLDPDTHNGEEYALSRRIDMSYAGKPDQCGSPAIFLSENQYKRLWGVIDEWLI